MRDSQPHCGNQQDKNAQVHRYIYNTVTRKYILIWNYYCVPHNPVIINKMEANRKPSTKFTARFPPVRIDAEDAYICDTFTLQRAMRLAYLWWYKRDANDIFVCNSPPPSIDVPPTRWSEPHQLGRSMRDDTCRPNVTTSHFRLQCLLSLRRPRQQAMFLCVATRNCF